MSSEGKHSTDWRKQVLELIHSTCLATDFQSASISFLREASNLIECDGASLMWLSGDHLEVVASTGSTAPLSGLILPVRQMGAAQAVLDSGRPVVVADVTKASRWQLVPGEEQAQSWLGVPLLVDARSIGLLEWTDRNPATFDEDDVELVAELAQYASPVLYRAQLLDDTRQHLRELTGPQLTTTQQPRDIGAALKPVVREARDFTSARHAFVFLRGSEGGPLRCVVALGDQHDRLKSTILCGDGTLAGWGMATPDSAQWRNTGSSDREEMRALGIKRTLCLPLRVGGEQVGLLGVAEPRHGRSFDRDAVRLMTYLASQASVIVERAGRRQPESAEYDYATVLHASPLGVGVLSVTGEFQICNPALASLLFGSNRSPVGHNLSEFLVPSDAQRLLHALEEVAITGQRRQLDTRMYLAKGEYRHVRMSLAYARISQDSGGGVVAIVEDVSPLKILEQERVEHLRELRDKHAQLQELDKLKSRFVSNVSHELRTPLAVIKLYATLALKGRPEKQSYYLQTIEQETHRLETMVENILDLTRLDRQALRVQLEPLSAQEIITQVLEVYEETAKRRGIGLVNRVCADLPRFQADKNHLIQMLTNLLDNALKYTPRGQEVWVSAQETASDSKRMLEITVGDKGVGIPEEEQERVFERFYRGSNNTPGSTGTGLGLAIVWELMTQHGGQVALTSKVGEGSIFALQFPLTTSNASTSDPGDADIG